MKFKDSTRYGSINVKMLLRKHKNARDFKKSFFIISMGLYRYARKGRLLFNNCRKRIRWRSRPSKMLLIKSKLLRTRKHPIVSLIISILLLKIRNKCSLLRLLLLPLLSLHPKELKLNNVKCQFSLILNPWSRSLRVLYINIEDLLFLERKLEIIEIGVCWRGGIQR